MPLSFTFPQLGKQEATEGAVLGGVLPNPNDIREESLRAVGFEFASNQISPDYMFSPMGGWNPLFRASIIRVRTVHTLCTHWHTLTMRLLYADHLLQAPRRGPGRSAHDHLAARRLLHGLVPDHVCSGQLRSMRTLLVHM